MENVEKFKLSKKNVSHQLSFEPLNIVLGVTVPFEQFEKNLTSMG